MDLSRSRNRRVKLTYTINWPQQKNGGHLLAPNAARELDDGRVVSVGRDTTIRIWKDQQNIKTYYCHTDSVNDVDVQYYTNTPLIATAGSDYRVCFIDGSRHTPFPLHTEHTDAVKRVRFTVDNRLLSAGLDGKIVLWDLQHNTVLCKMGFDTGFFAMGIQPSSSKAIVGCMKGGLYSIDSREPNSKCRPYQPHAHSGTVRDIAFIDDTTFVTGGSDGVIRLWDLRNPRQSYKLHCHLHHEPIFSLATKGHYVLSAGRDGTVLLTDPQRMQTATVIQMNYPIFDISWNPNSSVSNGKRSQHVTVCSSKPNVELYELSTCFDDEGVDTPYRTPTNTSHVMHDTSAVSVTSPSKVELILDEESEQLELIEGRKFGRLRYRILNHPSKKAEKLWCTSVSSPRIDDQEFALGNNLSPVSPLPKIELRGSTEGFVSARLLSDKRHAIAMTAKGTIELWNIIDMKKIDGPYTKAKSMRGAVKACGPYAYGASWCRIDCAWGALRITLSHDEAFNAQVNLWEFRYLSSIANSKDNLSIYHFNAKERKEMTGKIINIGEEILRTWVKNQADVYVVQTKQSTGSSENTSSAPSSILTTFSEASDGKIPTWALTSLSSGAPSARSSAATTSVNVTLEPLESSNKFKTINLSVPKIRPVADLCAEVIAQNKISSMMVSELGDPRIKCSSPATTTASPDEIIEFIAVTKELENEVTEDDDHNNSGSDYGSDDCSSPTAISPMAENIERIIDPLMMVVTAFYTYKERGSGVLRIKYRIRRGVKPEDL